MPVPLLPPAPLRAATQRDVLLFAQSHMHANTLGWLAASLTQIHIALYEEASGVLDSQHRKIIKRFFVCWPRFTHMCSPCIFCLVLFLLGSEVI